MWDQAMKRLTILVAALVVALATPAAASRSDEAELLAAINQTRAAAGLNTLTEDAGLRSHARSHVEDMAASGSLSHSPTLPARIAGENVGRGATPSAVHEAFLASPAHKANMEADWTHVGVGAAHASGVLYVTVIFARFPEPKPITPDTTVATLSSRATAISYTSEPLEPAVICTDVCRLPGGWEVS